jgi:hypothetical protein
MRPPCFSYIQRLGCHGVVVPCQTDQTSESPAVDFCSGERHCIPLHLISSVDLYGFGTVRDQCSVSQYIIANGIGESESWRGPLADCPSSPNRTTRTEQRPARVLGSYPTILCLKFASCIGLLGPVINILRRELIGEESTALHSGPRCLVYHPMETLALSRPG